MPARFPHYLLLSLACLFSFSRHSAGAELFSMQSIVMSGTILSAVPADIDYKGAAEIIVLSKTGSHPNEKRWISVFETTAPHQFSKHARQRWELDPAATMFEVGDIAPSPGQEIFYLTNGGVSYYPQGRDGQFSTTPLTLLSAPTITVSPDAGTLPRTHLLADWKGNGRKILLLPQFEAFVFYEQNDYGKWQKTDTVSVTPRAFLLSDHQDDGTFKDFSIHTEFRLPRIFAGDFNADGLKDLLLTEQESLSVHYQKNDGHFSPQPSFTHAFPVRPSGKEADTNLFFLTTPVDINRDQFVDVILTLSRGTGKFLEQKIIIFLFLNRQNPKSPYSASPDQIIAVEGATPGVNFVDANGDGKTDLLLTKIRLGFWKIVQNLISKRVHLITTIYLLNDAYRYPEAPDFMLKTDYKIDLTHRISFRGTWPVLKRDFNGDSRMDLLIARDGKIEIFLNQSDKALFSHYHIQTDLLTYPFIHIADLDKDGLNDLLFYQKKRDGKISILLNKGNWEDIPHSAKGRGAEMDR
jgi:hypothetical protein